jgi:hypothetical protein
LILGYSTFSTIFLVNNIVPISYGCSAVFYRSPQDHGTRFLSKAKIGSLRLQPRHGCSDLNGGLMPYLRETRGKATQGNKVGLQEISVVIE